MKINEKKATFHARKKKKSREMLEDNLHIIPWIRRFIFKRFTRIIFLKSVLYDLKLQQVEIFIICYIKFKALHG